VPTGGEERIAECTGAILRIWEVPLLRVELVTTLEFCLENLIFYSILQRNEEQASIHSLNPFSQLWFALYISTQSLATEEY